MNRRRFCVLGVGLAASALTGCTTSMWERTREQQTRIEVETIHAFLASQDKQQLVILGEQHHYVFEAPAAIRVLQSDLRPHYIVDISQMQVNNDAGEAKARVSGRVTFGVAVNGLNAAQRQQVAALGFLPSKNATEQQTLRELARSRGMNLPPQAELWVWSTDLPGQRYQPQSGVNYAQGTKFFRNYTVPVRVVSDKRNAGKVAAAALATPVTVAADGLLFLFGAPLLWIGCKGDISGCLSWH